MSPAQPTRKRSLEERVASATQHADPDVRALAEAVLMLLEKVGGGREG